MNLWLSCTASLSCSTNLWDFFHLFNYPPSEYYKFRLDSEMTSKISSLLRHRLVNPLTMILHNKL